MEMPPTKSAEAVCESKFRYKLSKDEQSLFRMIKMCVAKTECRNIENRMIKSMWNAETIFAIPQEKARSAV